MYFNLELFLNSSFNDQLSIVSRYPENHISDEPNYCESKEICLVTFFSLELFSLQIFCSYFHWEEMNGKYKTTTQWTKKNDYTQILLSSSVNKRENQTLSRILCKLSSLFTVLTSLAIPTPNFQTHFHTQNRNGFTWIMMLI